MGRGLVGRLRDRQKPTPRRVGTAGEKDMTNEEVKEYLKFRIKENKEMVEGQIELLVDEAKRFIDNMQDEKRNTWDKLCEVHDLIDTIQRYYEVMDETNMHTSAYKVALGLLED